MQYDAMGNVVKQTLTLAELSSPENSPITETSFGAESLEDGVYSITTTTRYNAAGNVTTTVYCDCCDQPATITDAQGNTTCYRYDIRGRKVAEWGSGIQPAVFGYDDAGNMTSLTAFRHPGSVISSDPAEWEGLVHDTTTWTFDPAAGLELRKAYADNTATVELHKFILPFTASVSVRCTV